MNIPERLSRLLSLKADHMLIGKALGGDLFMLDFLAFTVLNRSLCLVSGFASLIEQRNFIAAAPLVRFQLDNTLRFYASTIVEKPHEFSSALLRGERIRDMQDSTGKKLRDDYLLKRLVADPRLTLDRAWVTSVYKETSGYVHLSEKHMFHCLQAAGEGGSVQMKVSAVDEYVPKSIYLEAIDGMTEATRLTLELVSYWAHQKATACDVAAATGQEAETLSGEG